jgi:hypothetical protein
MGLLMQVLSAKEAGPQLDLGPLIRKLNSNIRKATKTRATPPPAPVPPGTIAEQILGVLQTAPDGLTNAQIARALGKKQTDTHKPLERLVRHGKARKEGVMYFYVEQKAEVPA